MPARGADDPIGSTSPSPDAQRRRQVFETRVRNRVWHSPTMTRPRFILAGLGLVFVGGLVLGLLKAPTWVGVAFVVAVMVVAVPYYLRTWGSGPGDGPGARR